MQTKIASQLVAGDEIVFMSRVLSVHQVTVGSEYTVIEPLLEGMHVATITLLNSTALTPVFKIKSEDDLTQQFFNELLEALGEKIEEDN